MSYYRELSDSDGKELVETARLIVTEFLINKNKKKLSDDFQSRFSFKSGVFVTLNNRSGLRGCIGFPLTQKRLCDALVDVAIAAATEDPRFSEVELSELNEITFDVTVITPPIEIKVSDPLEYLTQIKIGRDGLIVKHGVYSGLLLPQVPVEYGWTKEEFLNHTCEKAGIPHDVWKDPETEILRFEGIIFKEETPNGKVTQQKL
ncbi:MAG: TIGR00296 family protein [Thaumarchaeota archaeon]|nr:TIGR00296 family protein [Nitrososphaerota archaeon]